jgi:hypothetical protein
MKRKKNIRSTAMKETTKITQTAQTTHDSLADMDQASKIGLAMVVSFAGLVGAWGLACMAGALATQGIGGVISGFLTAITGM